MWWLLVAGLIAYIIIRSVTKNTGDISQTEERCFGCVSEGKCTEDDKQKCYWANR